MTQHTVSSVLPRITLDAIMVMSETLGEFVRRERERRGMTLTALADAAELSKSELSALERGKIALPGAAKRRRLAAALGVSHLDLLVAAGEITRDEIEPLGVRGTVEPDPVRAELIASLNRLPLTGDRPAAIRGLIDVYADIDRRTAEARESVDTQGNGGDITGID
ncbi:MAG: helix-turn-helix domain-containing protein [Thermomicrobiales bacterium]|nr:helix-turn-helix domain-containing protein [Thermomicrobiales bacterium]